MENPDLADLSRREISNLSLPQELKSFTFNCIQIDQNTQIIKDPFLLKFIPNRKDLDAAIDYLRVYKQNNHNVEYGIAFEDDIVLNLRTLQRLQSCSLFREIKKEIKEEDSWLHNLTRTLNCPFPNRTNEFVEYGAQYISLIQSFNNFKDISELNLRVNTLKELVGKRLLSDSFLSFFINKINKQSETSFCMSFLEEFQGEWSQGVIRRFHQKFKTIDPQVLVIFLNVGRYTKKVGFRHEFETFIGRFTDEENNIYTACHYSMLVYNFGKNECQYCDSMGWEQPVMLSENFTSLLSALSIKERPNAVLNCHFPNDFVGKHKCDVNKCATFYPLQSCGDICGICVIVCATLASFSYTSFKYLCGNKPRDCEMQIDYLKRISNYGNFLRVVLMKWSIENKITISDLSNRITISSAADSNNLSNETKIDSTIENIIYEKETNETDRLHRNDLYSLMKNQKIEIVNQISDHTTIIKSSISNSNKLPNLNFTSDITSISHNQTETLYEKNNNPNKISLCNFENDTSSMINVSNISSVSAIKYDENDILLNKHKNVQNKIYVNKSVATSNASQHNINIISSTENESNNTSNNESSNHITFPRNKDNIVNSELFIILYCELERIETQLLKKFIEVCSGKWCAITSKHIHCKLCNDETFVSDYYINRHLKQVHLNKKHCVKYQSMACIPCRVRSHTTSNSTRKFNHYHCPLCNTAILQKSSFQKHLLHHDQVKN